MNRFALVTGASRGIGRGIALELAGAGYDLLINYARNEEAALEAARLCEEAARQKGHVISVRIFGADIADRGARAALVEFARKNFSRIDLLVNNAGVAPDVRADLLEATEESFDRLMAINVKGPYFLTQAIANWMIQSRKQQGSSQYLPKIITVSSISAYTASVNRGDYCVSKAALSMLTPLFASRLAEDGINVFEIRPGIIETDMTSAVKGKYDALISQGLTPIPRWGTPLDIGKAVTAVAQDLFPFSTGEVLNVDGGFHLRRL